MIYSYHIDTLKFLFIKYNYDGDIVIIKNQNGNCQKMCGKIDKFDQMFKVLRLLVWKEHVSLS